MHVQWFLDGIHSTTKDYLYIPRLQCEDLFLVFFTISTLPYVLLYYYLPIWSGLWMQENVMCVRDFQFHYHQFPFSEIDWLFFVCAIFHVACKSNSILLKVKMSQSFKQFVDVFCFLKLQKNRFRWRDCAKVILCNFFFVKSAKNVDQGGKFVTNTIKQCMTSNFLKLSDVDLGAAVFCCHYFCS